MDETGDACRGTVKRRVLLRSRFVTREIPLRTAETRPAYCESEIANSLREPCLPHQP